MQPALSGLQIVSAWNIIHQRSILSIEPETATAISVSLPVLKYYPENVRSTHDAERHTPHSALCNAVSKRILYYAAPMFCHINPAMLPRRFAMFSAIRLAMYADQYHHQMQRESRSLLYSNVCSTLLASLGLVPVSRARTQVRALTFDSGIEIRNANGGSTNASASGGTSSKLEFGCCGCAQRFVPAAACGDRVSCCTRILANLLDGYHSINCPFRASVFKLLARGMIIKSSYNCYRVSFTYRVHFLCGSFPLNYQMPRCGWVEP